MFVDYKDRKCTDVLCLLLFVAFWAGMFVIAGIGFRMVRWGFDVVGAATSVSLLLTALFAAPVV